MIHYIVAVLRDQDSHMLGTGQAEDEVSFFSEDSVFASTLPEEEVALLWSPPKRCRFVLWLFLEQSGLLIFFTCQ